MPAISVIKKEREFYEDFLSLVNVLKTIAMSQFRAFEQKLLLYMQFVQTVAVVDFFSMLDLNSIHHPFVRPKENTPLGVVAITSDLGLLGGLNNRVMTAAFNHMENPKNQLIVVGQQGQNFMQGLDVDFKGFIVGEEEEFYDRALELRDHIINEVLSKRIGPVKVYYASAPSMQVQEIMEVDLLPCTHIVEAEGVQWDESSEGVLLDSNPADLVEYLTFLLIGQKLCEILQFSRLAEFAARTVHLEESSETIKEIDAKLRLKYFRARHEIVDQQMRELFTARSIYAEKDQ